MKVRNYFVSNSSSSSFVVPLLKQSFDREVGVRTKTTFLSDVQTTKLKEYGFKLTSRPYYPTTEGKDWSLGKSKFEIASLDKLNPYQNIWFYFSVACNQDDVLRFLVTNGIPFIASVHYGHATYVWRPVEDIIHVLPNLGVEVETYGIENFLESKKEAINGKQELTYHTISAIDYGKKKAKGAKHGQK